MMSLRQKNVDQQAIQRIYSTLVLRKSKNDSEMLLIKQLEEACAEMDRNYLMPNIISHIYTSCSILDKENDSADFWSSLDRLSTEILPFMKLKNLATLSHGLSQRKLDLPNEFVGAFLCQFIRAYW